MKNYASTIAAVCSTVVLFAVTCGQPALAQQATSDPGFNSPATCITTDASGQLRALKPGDCAQFGTVGQGISTEKAKNVILMISDGAVGMDVAGNPVATLAELGRAKGMKVGNVTTSEIQDATPATFATHARAVAGTIQGVSGFCWQLGDGRRPVCCRSVCGCPRRVAVDYVQRGYRNGPRSRPRPHRCDEVGYFPCSSGG